MNNITSDDDKENEKNRHCISFV